ncbi:MAG: class I SAM-dependent methyltransferase [Cyanobacteria bacterium P01_D01_bin.44]
MDIAKQRAQTFNQVARLYNTARPSYPIGLIKDLEELAQLQDTSRILEVGTGTGKATLPFAQRGYTIHCLEPGNQLAIVADENLSSYPTVTIETVTFEDWPLQAAAYDLVMSAQAFHWVDPEVGYAKAAQALKSTGQIALIWNIGTRTDDVITQQLDRAYTTYANWRLRSFEERVSEREQELVASQHFTEPIIKHYPWSQRYTTQQYLDLVRTQSDYLIQSEAKQRELLDEIVTVIENNGGSIVRTYASVLMLANKTRSA